MKKITIIGYGRFGKTLHRLLQDDFDITIYQRHPESSSVTADLATAYTNDTIFYAVPISAFESVIKQHKPYITNNHLLLDVLSVKEYPKKIFQKYFKNTKTQILLTHPMFGPDSSNNGFSNLPIILDKFRITEKEYNFWHSYFTRKQLRVIEMTAKQHDLLAAQSQGVTHFIGRVLEEYSFKETPIDSLGTQKLHEVMTQTCHDTWQLFKDLQQYNPYTINMRVTLGHAYKKIYTVLLPKQVNTHYITFGIQGGKGSFNEEAIQTYISQQKIKKYKIKYLYTSEKVLSALHKGEIDKGQFAIHNSVGGIVGESIHAMAKYTCTIKKEFAIKIAHALMIRKDATIQDITTIMTHPQVLAQCKSTLAQKYPQIEKLSGKGELIDHAKVAKFLAEKKLPKHIAVMGSKVLATIYDLTVVDDNLQDAKENWTSFLVVVR